MNAPTPRQQAGYLRRLLRRGEVRVVDPTNGRRVPAVVELRGEVIRLIPVLEPAARSDPPSRADLRWSSIQARMRECMTLDEAEELLAAVVAEADRRTA